MNITSEQNLRQIVDWVKAHPQSATMHVTLRSSPHDAEARRIQSSFQALGCTVTTKQLVGRTK